MRTMRKKTVSRSGQQLTAKSTESGTLFTVLFLFILIAAGVALGVFIMNTNITSNETEQSFWSGVETTESEYEHIIVSVSDCEFVVSPAVSDSDILSQTDAPKKMWNVNDIDSLSVLMKAEYEKVHKVNSDVIGWIYFPSANRDMSYINEPLFDDRTRFYLHNDMYGENAGGGQIFVEPKTEPWEHSLVIHGHNMTAGTHLGRLKYLTNEADFTENRLIYVYVAAEDRVRVYVTFSSLLFGSDSYVPHQYMYSDKTEQDFIEYADLLHSLSMFDCEYEYTHIISFHTCNRSFKGAHLLLSAYLIDESQYIVSSTPIEKLQSQTK